METISRKVVGNVEYLLTLTRASITDPARWQQHSYGDAYGAQCTSGALSTMAHKQGFQYYHEAYELLREHMNGGIPTFNDSHTHAEVLAALDEAIAEAQERGI